MSTAVRRPALLVLVLLLALAGCGAGERWGGYTQKEAKEIMLDPEVKSTILQATPRKEDQQPVVDIYPDKKKLDKNAPSVKQTELEELREIGDTLLRLVMPDMTPKQLLKAAKKAHPKASKQEVVRAAFYVIISKADVEPEKAKDLHAFAINERTGTGT